jgi:hypothetical protein
VLLPLVRGGISRLDPKPKLGTRFLDPGGMKGSIFLSTASMLHVQRNYMKTWDSPIWHPKLVVLEKNAARLDNSFDQW